MGWPRLEYRFSGGGTALPAFLRVGWEFSPFLASAAENRPGFLGGGDPGRQLGGAANLRIRTSEKRLAVAATITGIFVETVPKGTCLVQEHRVSG